MLNRFHIGIKAVRALASLFAAAGVIALFAAAAGAGSISGATGLIEIPSADVLANGELELSVRHIDGRLGLSAVYGILDDIEVGVNNIRAASDGRIGVVFKGTIHRETERRPGIAIGLETGQSYAALSKRLAPGVRLHAGYGIGRIKGLFAGVSYSVSTVSARGVASPATTLLGEFTSRGVNVGARLVFSPVFAADIALIDFKEATAGVSARLRF